MLACLRISGIVHVRSKVELERLNFSYYRLPGRVHAWRVSQSPRSMGDIAAPLGEQAPGGRALQWEQAAGGRARQLSHMVFLTPGRSYLQSAHARPLTYDRCYGAQLLPATIYGCLGQWLQVVALLCGPSSKDVAPFSCLTTMWFPSALGGP